MTDTCLWCGKNKGLVKSHALKKRSLGGKETISLCYPCDIWFDEHNAKLVREGDLLVGYDNDGNVLGKVPAEPERLPNVFVPVPCADPSGVGFFETTGFGEMEHRALRLADDSLFGALSAACTLGDAMGWAKRVLCYAIKVRYGWREGWATVAAGRIDALSGVRLGRAQIHQYARDWELAREELSDQLEALVELKPTVMSLIARAKDTTGRLTVEEARREAANVVLEEPGRSVRDTAGILQERGLLSRDPSVWAQLRRAAVAGDRETIMELEERWLQSEWNTPELLALYGDIGCFAMWAVGRPVGGGNSDDEVAQ